MNKITLKLNSLKALGFFTIAFFFIVGTVWFSSWLTKKTGVSDTQPTPPFTKPPVTCPADSHSYKSLIENNGKVAKLIDGRKSMFASRGRFVNAQIIITKNETEESKVACGYLLVRAGTEKGALQSFEDVYINPDNFGGHINPVNQIGIGDGNEFSEYIFPLNKIQYWKTKNRRNLLSADWASLLNVSEEVTFIIALNTEDRSGFIDEISIAYKCWNPRTGEENNECELEVTNKGDIETDSPVE